MATRNDFKKSGLAFAIGTGLVGVLVSFRSGGSLVAICATVGIPAFMFGVYALHQRRQETRLRIIAEMQNTQFKVMPRLSRERLDIIFGKNLNENPLAYVRTPGHIERRVLLPRDHHITKQRILQGRAPAIADEEVDVRDQWHS